MQGNSYTVGDITNATIDGFIVGDQDTVIVTSNATGQTELARALKDLTKAVQASHELSPDQKEEQIKVINQIGKEAAEPKPNKTLLKILVDGLLATLKAVPDVAVAVTAVMPILSQLHL